MFNHVFFLDPKLANVKLRKNFGCGESTYLKKLQNILIHAKIFRSYQLIYFIILDENSFKKKCL